MLLHIYQDTAGLDPEIQKVGCLFLCFAQVSPIRFEGKSGINKLNYIWKIAKEIGAIDHDLVIVKHEGVAHLFDLNIKYDDKHHKASEDIPDNVAFIFGEYVWKNSHFVVLGRQKQIIFDPKIASKTVAYGTLKTMRWYTAVFEAVTEGAD